MAGPPRREGYLPPKPVPEKPMAVYNPWNDFQQQMKESDLTKEEIRILYYKWKEKHGIVTKNRSKPAVPLKVSASASAGSSETWQKQSGQQANGHFEPSGRGTTRAEDQTTRVRPGSLSESENEFEKMDVDSSHDQIRNTSTSAAACAKTASAGVERQFVDEGVEGSEEVEKSQGRMPPRVAHPQGRPLK